MLKRDVDEQKASGYSSPWIAAGPAADPAAAAGDPAHPGSGDEDLVYGGFLPHHAVPGESASLAQVSASKKGYGDQQV